MRPRIGVTLAHHEAGTVQRFAQRQEYFGAIEAVGGLVFGLAPGKPNDVGEILDNLDGVLLTGGSDIDPALFGEPRHAAVAEADIHRDRDVFEIALAQAAVARDLPLLAICRGIQVLNVALGGTLVQDIPSQVKGHREHDPGGERHGHAHDVAVAAGTRLYEMLGKRPQVPVNSFHHQAIARLGTGLVVSARAADSVIEGVERPDRRFVVGVQWHPEGFFGHGDEFAPLFSAFLQSCEAACRA